MDEDTNMLTPGASDTLGLGLLDDTAGKTTEQDSDDSDDGPDGLFEDDDDEDEDNDNDDAEAAGVAGGSQPQVGEKRKLDEDDEYD